MKSIRKRLFAGAAVHRLVNEDLEKIVGQYGREFQRLSEPLADAATLELSLLPWAAQMLPHYITRPPSAMHRWLAEQFERMSAERGSKLNVVGPRGAAKSTIAALVWPLRLAVEAREPYIWIVSDTKEQARRHLDNLSAELTDNGALAAAYPSAVGFGVARRGTTLALDNGVIVEAFGSGQKLRGRRAHAHRPSLIICDDLQNDQHAQSAILRDQSRQWFHGMLLKAGTKRTNFVNLATALHEDALAMELMRNPGWHSQVFRAVERWPDNMHLWAEWAAIYGDAARPDHQAAARAFFEAHRAEMEQGVELLWPEEEDLYTLMCMRADSGVAAFEREKQGFPANPGVCEFPPHYFDGPLWFDHWPRTLSVKAMALDPSKGTDARHGDYSAIVMLGIDGPLLYVDADLARRPTPQMIADGVECWRRFRPDAFGVEANQFQDLLAPMFEAEFAVQGLLTAAVTPLVNHVSKRVRIRRLGPMLIGKRLRFKSDSPSARLLVRQLMDFPLGDHDDGPDALEMALRVASDVIEQRRFDDGLGSRLFLDV